MADKASSESVKAKLQDRLRRKSKELMSSRIKNVFETKFSKGCDLVMKEEQTEGGKVFLELKRRFADIIVDVKNGGPLHSARAVIDENGTATFQVLHKFHSSVELAKEDGVVNEDALKDLIELFGPECFCCVGMIPSEFDEITKNIHIVLKSKEELKYPFHRIVSKRCSHWFKVGRNISKEQKEKGATCRECKTFFRYVRRMNIKNGRESAKLSMENRLKVSSYFGISKLTPVSKKRRFLATTWKRAEQQKKIKMYERKLEEFEVEMNETQNQEMESIVQWINCNAVNDLESVLAESENQEMSDVIREKWLKDTEDRQTFYRDQFSNQGKTKSNGNRWSMITYRIALAIYIRSPAAYNALKSFEILQLPSTKSLQLFTSVRNHSPGINEEYIEEKMHDYQAMSEEKVKNGFMKPLGLGILIFDEVKVIGKVMLNMKNEKFLGLAMSEDEICNLHDIFKNLDVVEPVAAEYMLQYLWRDLTSDFDVIGPFYSFKETIDNTVVIETLFQTMRLFHNYEFKTNSVVCDGASSNMAAIKLLTTSKRGAFGVSDDPKAKHKVEPWFKNPFDSDLNVFCIICPSHQLKNMINALFASRIGGTKAFRMEKSGPVFGWKAIIGMWQRERSRVEAGTMKRVPKLLPAYIQRDAWTKLNVAPAKIMQQDNVLTELFEYVHQGDGVDCVSTNLSRDYLVACNKIFERGILSHDKITIRDMTTMQNMLEGYTFFENWWESLNNGDDFKPNDSEERRFISWQTWDLLRIVIFGFQGLVKSFLAQHPDNYIFPLKVNGSAVETLFSQFKFETNSKLNSVNYANARSRVLLKKDISGTAKAAHGYRDTPLYVKEKILKRK